MKTSSTTSSISHKIVADIYAWYPVSVSRARLAISRRPMLRTPTQENKI